jgi:hypothetical protein
MFFSNSVGNLAQKIEKIYDYQVLIVFKIVVDKIISVILDVITIIFTADGKKASYREVMIGVIRLIDDVGSCLHTIYLGAALSL